MGYMDGSGLNKLNKAKEMDKIAFGDDKKKSIDFNNLEVAFRGKSTQELEQSRWLLRVLGKNWLVNLGATFTPFLLRLNFQWVENLILKTIFKQFVGGTNLLNSQATIEKLHSQNCFTVLDYGAEAKTTEKEYNTTTMEFTRAIEFGSTHEAVSIITVKISAIARFELLEKIQSDKKLSQEENLEKQNIVKRLQSICQKAEEKNIGVFFDAEESWIQKAIDEMVLEMMAVYNKKSCIVYNTYQLYRNDKLEQLKSDFETAKSKGYILGAKLVRGAYLEKEAKYAKEKDLPSVINPTKKATDHEFDAAVQFCLDNYEHIAICCGTHNLKSTQLMAEKIAELKIDKNHPHLLFCQLYGMGDYLSFNLSHNGYKVAKYLPYGTVKEVIPYLIRRARENTSIQGEVGREIQLVSTELKRRKSK